MDKIPRQIFRWKLLNFPWRSNIHISVRKVTIAKPRVRTVIIDVRTHRPVTVFWVCTVSMRSNAAQRGSNSKAKSLFSSIFQAIVQTSKMLYFSPFKWCRFSTIFDFFFYFFSIYFEALRVRISRCSLYVNLYNFVRSFQRCIFYSILSYEWKLS